MRKIMGQVSLLYLIFASVNSSISHPTKSTALRHISPLKSIATSRSSNSFRDSMREGLCGAIAGTAQVASLMWLRTTMSYQHRYGLSMKDALQELYIQGGIPRFYKGLGFALIQAPLSKFTSVAANDFTSFIIRYSNSTKSSVLVTTALGGAIASLMRVALMPIDTCKTVLQVDGSQGFQRLVKRVLEGHISSLYQGTAATLISTFAGHYPWYLVHNLLEATLPVPPTISLKIAKSSIIALLATTFSDVVTNALRVVKTVKQTTLGNREISYLGIILTITREGGVKELFQRGLMSRIVADCLQSIVFTIIWKLLSIR